MAIGPLFFCVSSYVHVCKQKAYFKTLLTNLNISESYCRSWVGNELLYRPGATAALPLGYIDRALYWRRERINMTFIRSSDFFFG